MASLSREDGASVALFLAASAWGLYWYPLREMEQLGVTGTWAVAYFNLFPALVLFPYVLWRAGIEFRHFRKATLIGLFAGVGLGLYSSSMLMTSVVRATFIFYLTPIWGSVIGAVWLNERLNPRRYLAIGGGLLGLWLMLGTGSLMTTPLNLGDLFALAAGFLWALSAAAMKRWPEAPVAGASLIQFLFAVVFCAALGLLVFEIPAPDRDQLMASFPISFIASTLILLPSVFVIFWASRIVYPGRGGILMMSEVLVAIISASILLPSETLSTLQWLGGCTILAACLVEVRSSTARKVV